MNMNNNALYVNQSAARDYVELVVSMHELDSHFDMCELTEEDKKEDYDAEELFPVSFNSLGISWRDFL